MSPVNTSPVPPVAMPGFPPRGDVYVPIGGRDDRPGALEHHPHAIGDRGLPCGAHAVILDVARGAVDEPPQLPGMGGDDHIPLFLFQDFRDAVDDVDAVGVEHHRKRDLPDEAPDRLPGAPAGAQPRPHDESVDRGVIPEEFHYRVTGSGGERPLFVRQRQGHRLNEGGLQDRVEGSGHADGHQARPGPDGRRPRQGRGAGLPFRPGHHQQMPVGPLVGLRLPVGEQPRKEVRGEKVMGEGCPLDQGAGYGDVQEIEPSGVGRPRVDELARLGEGKRAGDVRPHRPAQDMAGVRVDARGDVHGKYHLSVVSGVVDAVYHPADSSRHLPVQAGAEHGVNRHREVAQCVCQGQDVLVGGHRYDRDVHFPDRIEIVRRLPGPHLLERAGDEHPDVDAVVGQVAGHDKPVAAVVAGAADDHDAARCLGGDLQQQADGACAGVFHQHGPGDGELLHGPAVDFLNLCCRCELHGFTCSLFGCVLK